MKFSIAALALTAAFGSAFATAAEVQNFPSKPIRAIVSSSAGGTSDIFMRVLAEELHKRLGQPVIVENRPGGAFNIGARVCAEAAPDGYTVCMMSAEPVAFNQFLFKTLPFDPAVQSVAVMGALALEDNIGDHGSSQVHPPSVVTPPGAGPVVAAPSLRTQPKPRSTSGSSRTASSANTSSAGRPSR
jgi:hypothetical protein